MANNPYKNFQTKTLTHQLRPLPLPRRLSYPPRTPLAPPPRPRRPVPLVTTALARLSAFSGPDIRSISSTRVAASLSEIS